MAIELIVEDGTIVDDANSYNSLETIKEFAALRNLTLSDHDEVTKGYAILAMDFLEAQAYLGERFMGLEQALEWPRIDVIVGPDSYATDYIPPRLKFAQSRLVVDLQNKIELFPSLVTVDRIKRKTVGPVTTEWFENPSIAPILSAVDALLAPLLDGGGFGLRTIRI